MEASRRPADATAATAAVDTATAASTAASGDATTNDAAALDAARTAHGTAHGTAGGAAVRATHRLAAWCRPSDGMAAWVPTTSGTSPRTARSQQRCAGDDGINGTAHRLHVGRGRARGARGGARGL